jgi:hypothetical protein
MVLRVLALLALLPYALWLALSYEYHALDHVNLAIHEAGHVVFMPFGMTMHFLGGTLLQLAMPLAFVLAFTFKRRAFDAAVCVLWFAESLMYTAWYLRDAYLMQLPLVGGERHDWNWLLSRWGVVGHCEAIATGVHTVATVLALGAVARAAYVTWAQHGVSVSTRRTLAVEPDGEALPAASYTPRAWQQAEVLDDCGDVDDFID